MSKDGKFAFVVKSFVILMSHLMRKGLMLDLKKALFLMNFRNHHLRLTYRLLDYYYFLYVVEGRCFTFLFMAV